MDPQDKQRETTSWFLQIMSSVEADVMEWDSELEVKCNRTLVPITDHCRKTVAERGVWRICYHWKIAKSATVSTTHLREYHAKRQFLIFFFFFFCLQKFEIPKPVKHSARKKLYSGGRQIPVKETKCVYHNNKLNHKNKNKAENKFRRNIQRNPAYWNPQANQKTEQVSGVSS